MFGPVREAAGTPSSDFDAASVGALLDAAGERFGPGFAEMAVACRVWVNGEPADRDVAVSAGDEVALLPPVSGG